MIDTNSQPSEAEGNLRAIQVLLSELQLRRDQLVRARQIASAAEHQNPFVMTGFDLDLAKVDTDIQALLNRKAHWELQAKTSCSSLVAQELQPFAKFAEERVKFEQWCLQHRWSTALDAIGRYETEVVNRFWREWRRSAGILDQRVCPHGNEHYCGHCGPIPSESEN